MNGHIIAHPAAAVQRAAAELIARADSSAEARRIQRAADDLLAGALVIVEVGRWLTTSSTDAGTVYAIDAITGDCDCPARGPCRHQARIDVLERAACHVLPSAAQVWAQDIQRRRAAVDVADFDRAAA